MNQIKRVGIDLDGTVADYLKGAIPLLKQHYGLEPDMNIAAYTIEEVFGLTPETRPDGMREFLYEELHLFRKLPKLEADSEMLSILLKQEGVKVYFITARTGSNTVREDTLFWLDKNGFQYDDVFHVEDKADFCKKARIQVMCEDEIGQLLRLQAAGVNAVIRNQPWNLELPNDPHHLERRRGGQVRVYNWREAYNAIKEYLQ